MNILVTGCAGFIASHLIEELLKDKLNNVFGIDNLYTGTQENLKNVKSHDKYNKFKFFEEDIRIFEMINKIIKDNNIEQIYHLAAIVSVQESIENPTLSKEVNVDGTFNILEASRLNNVKKVVFSSSAAVYGDDPLLPKNELSPVKPISPYGLEKLIGEKYMKLYNDLYGIKTVSLRYFNVYGERQSSTSDYSGVISLFNNKFKNQELIYIYGDGEQYRDFIYVKDVVLANINAMSLDEVNTEVFCVGTSKKITINDIFKYMCEKYAQNSAPIYKKSRKGDILESVCDNTKLKRLLDIDNLLLLDKGINRI